MKKQSTPPCNVPVKYLTVCTKSRTWVKGRRAPVNPILYVCSPCLQQAGFKLGQVVQITSQPGQLIITLAPQQGYAAIKKLLLTGGAQII